MVDETCAVCERLWEAYDCAAQSHLILEEKSARETGLEALVRNALRRREEARRTVEEHEGSHMGAKLVASGVA